MVDILGIGLTGLRTSRANLSVTGHNITNIDTPSYTRQRAVQITNPAFGTSSGYYGTGSRTQTVERLVDGYTTYQIRTDTSRLKDQESFLRNATELDNVLANENSSLGRGINNLFDAIQTSSNDPLSMPARQLLYTEVDSISQRFNTSFNRLEDQNKSINLRLGTMVAKVNELARGIGSVNKEISFYEGSKNQPPNDLYDKREELLRELSEYVNLDIQVQYTQVEASNMANTETLQVTIGNGIPLVVGDRVNQLVVEPGEKDKTRYDVNLIEQINNKSVKMNITDHISSGEMGGLLRYRKETLDPALSQLGRIAMVFAGEINNQNRGGIDLDGNQGVDIFEDINTRRFQLERIPGLQPEINAGVWLDTDNLHKLPSQEFLLKQTGSGYKLVDARTGRDQTRSFADAGALNDHLEEKFGFRLTDGDNDVMDFANPAIAEKIKDGLLISPTRSGAGALNKSPDLTDINKLAMAGIAAGENNFSVAEVRYTNLNGINIEESDLAGARIVFDDANNGQFNLVNKNGQPLAGPTNLNKLSFNIEVNGETKTIELELTHPNNPSAILTADDFKNSDEWILEGVAGGENGSKLGKMQQAQLISVNENGSGGYTLADSYSMIIEEVGIKTAEARIATDVSAAALEQSVAMRESASGVNMDEEASNLIRFQQAYMASSQVIATAQKLFDTLISSVR